MGGVENRVQSVSMDDDFPILAAVAASPTHSYQVLDHLQSIGVKATRSTVFRRVDTLIAEGVLEARMERGPRGHARRTLALGEEGRRRVSESAARLLREEPLESPFFSLAVSCASALDEDSLPGILRARMARAARQLTSEERDLRLGPGHDEWETLTRERRIAHLVADIQWLQAALGRRLVTGTERPRHLPEAV